MARRGETGDEPAGTMSAGGGESYHGGTGLYNVSNTCYLNSVLQALSHVKEFRECLLSDASGVSLYAAREHEPGVNEHVMTHVLSIDHDSLST